MGSYKRPINRSMVIGISIFVIIMCAILAVLSYAQFSGALYSKYEEELTRITDYVEKMSDPDDLANCIKTKQPSEKYKEFQQFLNGYVDPAGLEYLYVVFPKGKMMVNVCSATNDKERSEGEKDTQLLDMTDAYSEEELDRYKGAMKSDKMSFFEESSDYGVYYTACRPLKDPGGKTFCLICADMSIDTLHGTITKYTLISIGAILGIGLLFMFILLYWMKKNVTGPVLELEKSANSFARRSSEDIKPEELVFDAPDINTENEVQSLSNAIEQMSDDIKSYVESVLSAEKRAIEAEKEALSPTGTAYKDPLTGVKSKDAFNIKMKELTGCIINDEEFAIVMIDVNDLDNINDRFGRDKGDEYLKGACRSICTTFKHSPVFRVGEDEFVVILQNDDYENRAQLFDVLISTFDKNYNDESKDVWERFWAAMGMAEYHKGDKCTVEDVLKKADEEMYQNKGQMKK